MFSIQSYNIYLASTGQDIDFAEYVKNVNKESNSNINLSLMNLIEYHNRNECCIPHSYLYAFRLLATKKGICRTCDIVSFLKTYTEGVDYIVRHVSIKKGKKIIIEDEYYIHPRAFKKMLLKKERCNDYINYYIFLEDCMYLYSDYKNRLNENITVIKNNAHITDSLKNIEDLVTNIESRLLIINELST